MQKITNTLVVADSKSVIIQSIALILATTALTKFTRMSFDEIGELLLSEAKKKYDGLSEQDIKNLLRQHESTELE